ncbi:hypothetical protein GOBAR_AA37836 [Gossypium barbadense]|uniref:Uncharacterized protein n=1 Tax=Gossypium barbadense TaxID=3634 RepID=A0A2P5VVP3_GOSBA|nr:hypothetical protein GOBAR_AA37836 [Gossypium barbadense]
MTKLPDHQPWGGNAAASTGFLRQERAEAGDRYLRLCPNSDFWLSPPFFLSLRHRGFAAALTRTGHHPHWARPGFPRRPTNLDSQDKRERSRKAKDPEGD